MDVLWAETPSAEHLHGQFPPGPAVSSSAYKPRVLKSAPHQCPAQHVGKLSLLLRTTTLPEPRATFSSVCPEVVQHDCAPVASPVLFLLAAYGGREDEKLHLEKSQASAFLFRLLLSLGVPLSGREESERILIRALKVKATSLHLSIQHSDGGPGRLTPVGQGS